MAEETICESCGQRASSDSSGWGALSISIEAGPFDGHSFSEFFVSDFVCSMPDCRKIATEETIRRAAEFVRGVVADAEEWRRKNPKIE